MKNLIVFLTSLCLSASLISQVAYKPKQPTKESIFKNAGDLEQVIARTEAWGDTIFLGNSKTKKHPIYAYYYNRGGTDKAMVMAGVHGSEFYGVDVAYALKAKLDSLNPGSFKWKVVIIPELFVDNVTKSRIQPEKARANLQRKTCSNCTDPNRQLPFINQLYKQGSTKAHVGNIEVENQYLLQLVQIFNPSRIASIHCKHEADSIQIGIYADPRTDSRQKAFGFDDDSTLAVEMALVVKKNKGRIFGNFKKNTFTAIYPRDSSAAVKDSTQYRSFQDSANAGVSFGTWASTRIQENGKTKNAAIMLTLELPHYYSFVKGKTKYLNITELYTNTNAYLKSLLDVFLSNQ